MNDTAIDDPFMQLALMGEKPSPSHQNLSTATSRERGTLHLIGGEKGGVGKSLMARLLVHYM